MHVKGMIGGGRREPTHQQWDTIRYKLDNIDMLLKKECLFCGSILIDMIDNHIEAAQTKLYEFAPVKSQEAGSSDLGPNVNRYEDKAATDAEWGIL